MVPAALQGYVHGRSRSRAAPRTFPAVSLRNPKQFDHESKNPKPRPCRRHGRAAAGCHRAIRDLRLVHFRLLANGLFFFPNRLESIRLDANRFLPIRHQSRRLVAVRFDARQLHTHGHDQLLDFAIIFDAVVELDGGVGARQYQPR